ncbi:phospholipase C [Nocardioides mangrovi]|uniref:Alkaline phosphatase family protein n=1 Tax=Nocardioides mangrovi TaxID=2874580 RepID=A0ABS7U796_9ACTN|nr:alkaline phosphatase family protein [Nocardioides mangrovi]MBZ5736682.1 alkaline phosphatase family protein [Nocardioides mangrovi]
MRTPKLTRARGAGVGLTAAALVATALAAGGVTQASAADPVATRAAGAARAADGTTTPIKHVVVIFSENVSFDHYFGTYPKAANTDGVRFTAGRRTPRVDNLRAHPELLKAKSATHPDGNPNSMPPFRYGPDEAVTCDQGHNYTPEEKAIDGGAMDKFVQNVSGDTCGLLNRVGQTMGYYDGNTVTALWNYAQHYSMSDNAWSDTFGPSTPGALEVVSGQTHGVMSYDPATGTEDPTQTTTPDTYGVHAPDADGVGTVIADPDPVYDDCADTNHTSSNALAGMQDSNKNIGDLMNAGGVSWGWFQGGFAPDVAYAGPGTYAQCTHTSENITGAPDVDYNPHHNPFEYYKSTSNPHHLAPASMAEIGHDGQANHQYDLSLFYDALKGTGGATMPAVSYVKAKNVEDGHAAYSDPIDEQHFMVRTINAIMTSKYWKNTAVVIAYDDSDGWYDHVAPTITNASSTADDVNTCTDPAGSGVAILSGYQDRCGPGQRLPFLVISPYAKRDHVGHSLITQASVVRFIEDNWGLGTIGDGSFADTAGKIDGLFDFGKHHDAAYLLRANGTPKKK